MTDERLTQLMRWFNDRPVLRALGASCARLEPGRSHGALRVVSDFNNPNGAVPGTTLASFVDIVGGMAVSTVSTSGEWFATLHLGINYLGPRSGPSSPADPTSSAAGAATPGFASMCSTTSSECASPPKARGR